MNEPTDDSQASVALGVWMGREQAFNALAHHCSAARIACLKQVRDTEAYKSLNLTWDRFCPEHAGISRTHADRLIRQLAEFGAPYFQLTDIVPVSPAVYREIEPAITGGAIEFRGEQIPIAAENAAKIKAAVHFFRKEAEDRANTPTLASIQGVQVRFDICFDDMTRLINRTVNHLDQAALRGLLTYCNRKLAHLGGLMRPPN